MNTKQAAPRKVFLVEDEVLVALEMAATLRDFGFEVVGPSVRFEAAKSKAMTADIDVALLDINLGKGATSEPIAEILRNRNIPLIFMTAYDRTQISYIQDADGLIKKPVHTALLNDLLAQTLSARPA